MEWGEGHDRALVCLKQWLRDFGCWMDSNDDDLAVVHRKDREQWGKTEDDFAYLAPSDLVRAVLNGYGDAPPPTGGFTTEELRVMSDALKSSGETALAGKVDRMRLLS